MHDREPAPSADRGALNMPQLPFGPRNLVSDWNRRGMDIADRQPTDVAGGAQIALHQRRRKRLDVGDVVEAAAERIGRQERIDVDLQVQQVGNCLFVFRSIQTLKRAPAWIRVLAGRCIHPSFECCGECAEGFAVGPSWRTRRRHHAGSELPNHLFGDLRVLINGGRVERRERQTAGFPTIVMATNTVLRDQGSLRIGRDGISNLSECRGRGKARH